MKDYNRLKANSKEKPPPFWPKEEPYSLTTNKDQKLEHQSNNSLLNLQP